MVALLTVEWIPAQVHRHALAAAGKRNSVTSWRGRVITEETGQATRQEKADERNPGSPHPKQDRGVRAPPAALHPDPRICAVVTILLATMTLLAIVDRFFYMPDEARYAFSGLAYVAAFIGAWFTCARLVWRSLDPRELARLIEAVRPDLREDLISAVELGDPHGQQQWESEEFREILQGNVARRMQSVSVSELLSFHKISAWVWVSTGVIAAVVSLLCVPGLSYDGCCCGRSIRSRTSNASRA